LIDFKKGYVHINHLKKFFNEENDHFFKIKQIILNVRFGDYSIEVISNFPSNPQVMIKKNDIFEKVIVKQEVVGEEETYFVLKHYIDLLDSFQETLRTMG